MKKMLVSTSSASPLQGPACQMDLQAVAKHHPAVRAYMRAAGSTAGADACWDVSYFESLTASKPTSCSFGSANCRENTENLPFSWAPLKCSKHHLRLGRGHACCAKGKQRLEIPAACLTWSEEVAPRRRYKLQDSLWDKIALNGSIIF